MKLHLYQELVAASKAQIVVLRWGKQTGKDTLIEHLRGPFDFVVEPASMAAESAEKYEGRWVFQDEVISNKNLLHRIKRDQKKHARTKRIFLNECAFYQRIELIPLIILLQREFPKAQIYLISTPRGGWKLGEPGTAGLEFDMICGNLEMHEVHQWFYSRHANTKKVADALVEEKPLTQNEKTEIFAGWWDIK